MGTSFTTTHIHNAQSLTKAQFKKAFTDMMKAKGYTASDEENAALTFEMDSTRFCEEDGCPQNIPQCPFEDLLDEYSVWVEDFYEDLNEDCEITCYQEFASSDIGDIRKLLTIIGKESYAAEVKKYVGQQ